jgi:splicing factor U2AF subunit
MPITNNNAIAPTKIFVGGLPYNLNDEQVTELLGAFGPIKAFNQVRDPGSQLTKGYAFCEYVTMESSEQACAGLNGMKIGEKTLTVRPAVPSIGGPSGGAGQNVTQMLQQQQQSQQSQYQPSNTYGMGGGGGGGGSNPLMGALGGGGMGMNVPGTAGLAPALGVPGMAPGMGMGGMGGTPVAPMQQQQQQAPISSAVAVNNAVLAALPPMRILLLTNMVSSQEIQDNAEYEDIREDVRLECADFGAVIRVLIPRECDGYMKHLEGSIFVEFADASAARSAALALNGRKFADKTVSVQYFDERKFATGNL